MELFVVDMETKLHTCDAFLHHTNIQEVRDVARHMYIEHESLKHGRMGGFVLYFCSA